MIYRDNYRVYLNIIINIGVPIGNINPEIPNFNHLDLAKTHQDTVRESYINTLANFIVDWISSGRSRLESDNAKDNNLLDLEYGKIDIQRISKNIGKLERNLKEGMKKYFPPKSN